MPAIAIPEGVLCPETMVVVFPPPTGTFINVPSAVCGRAQCLAWLLARCKLPTIANHRNRWRGCRWASRGCDWRQGRCGWRGGSVGAGAWAGDVPTTAASGVVVGGGVSAGEDARVAAATSGAADTGKGVSVAVPGGSGIAGPVTGDQSACARSPRPPEEAAGFTSTDQWFPGATVARRFVSRHTATVPSLTTSSRRDPVCDTVKAVPTTVNR